MYDYNMKIKKVEYTNSGIVIIFYSDISFGLKDIFKIQYRNKSYYFQVCSIETLENSRALKYAACEIGYWVKKIENSYNDGLSDNEKKLPLDIRSLININVEKVYNEEEIAEVLLENSWL